jgi:uncharacterized protein YpuA (DUF1002 family)
MTQSIPPVSLDSVSGSAYQSNVAERVRYVVAQVMSTHAGAPEQEVQRVLTERLRGMGVNPSDRQVQQLAEMITRLPRAA